MEDLIIRGETPEDYGAIRSLIVETFRAAYGTGDLEADLVERLRDQSAFGVNISLVALQNNLLVGHVFFSGVRIAEHPDIAACALAPLCVSQPLQRRGIGSMLTQRGLSACQDAGYKAAVVQGSPAYYGRFGFSPIGQFHLRTVFLSEYDTALALADGALDAVSGLVDYPAPWDALRDE